MLPSAVAPAFLPAWRRLSCLESRKRLGAGNLHNGIQLSLLRSSLAAGKSGLSQAFLTGLPRPRKPGAVSSPSSFGAIECARHIFDAYGVPWMSLTIWTIVLVLLCAFAIYVWRFESVFLKMTVIEIRGRRFSISPAPFPMKRSAACI